MTARIGQLRPSFAILAAALSFAPATHAVELNPAIMAYTTPDQYKWRDPTDKADVNQAILYGDPTKPGLYIYINKLKPGRFGGPHYHPNDRFITVIEGTGFKGTGPVVDPTNAMRLPKGSFVIDHAQKVHWDGTKDEGVSLLIAGEGPATNIEVPKAAGRFTGLDPAAVSVKLPDQIEWKGTGGNRTAVLVGDPDKPGLYVLMFKWLAGNFSRPHFHPNDRLITVLNGTWWVATGNKFDPATQTVAMPAGSFVTHFAKEVHWDGAKNEDTVLLMVGNGPATSTRVEEAK